MDAIQAVAKRIDCMLPILNERQRRRMLAAEAKVFGHGGIKIVSEISGVSERTIAAGIKERPTENVVLSNTIE